MPNHAEKGTSADQIDMPMIWFGFRGVELFFCIVSAKLIYLNLHSNSFWSDTISLVILLLVFFLFFHRVVTGMADTNGIHFRRYFRFKSIQWGDIRDVQWISHQLRIRIKDKGKLNGTLIFIMNPFSSQAAYWAHRLGYEVAPPAILERINALLIDTPPAMTSGPPISGFSRWLLRLWVGVAILLATIMVMRLILASR
jgi:hypothetical protein